MELNVEYSVPITSATAYAVPTAFEEKTGATISGTTAEFTTETLENNPTEFETWLDTCDVPEDTVNVVLSISYADDQNRSVDVMFELERMGVFDDVRSSMLNGTASFIKRRTMLPRT